MYEISDGSGHVLDRDIGVDAMLVKKIDVVGLQEAQRGFGYFSNVFGLAVRAGDLAVFDAEAKFCCDDSLLPMIS